MCRKQEPGISTMPTRRWRAEVDQASEDSMLKANHDEQRFAPEHESLVMLAYTVIEGMARTRGRNKRLQVGPRALTEPIAIGPYPRVYSWRCQQDEW